MRLIKFLLNYKQQAPLTFEVMKIENKRGRKSTKMKFQSIDQNGIELVFKDIVFRANGHPMQ